MANAEEIVKEIIGNVILMRIGQRSIVIIKKRTADGIFLDGSSANSNQYSTKPFVMPAGAVKRKDLFMRIKSGAYGDDARLFRTKAGALWVAIVKGYRWIREQLDRPAEHVDLWWSGSLMRSLKVQSVDIQKGEIVIGHNDERTSRLAEFHNTKGAGKGKVIRKYLALSEEELVSLASGL